MVPIDFSFLDPQSKKKSLDAVKKSAISLTWILELLVAARTRAVILDACRDQPQILKKLTPNQEVQPSLGSLTAVQGTGSLVAFSAGFNEVSSSVSDDGFSYYTHILVALLNKHPDDLSDALTAVQQEVADASHEKQNPAIYSEIHGKFMIAGTPLKTTGSGEQIQGFCNAFVQEVSCGSDPVMTLAFSDLCAGQANHRKRLIGLGSAGARQRESESSNNREGVIVPGCGPEYIPGAINN